MLVFTRLSLASQGLWFANAGLKMVATLAASESPGLFIKITCPFAAMIEILIY